MQLEQASEQERDEVLSYIRQVGLPTCLADLGVTEVNETELRKVAEIANSPSQFTKNVRADITVDDVYNAIMSVEAPETSK